MARNMRLHPRHQLSKRQRSRNHAAATEANIRTRKIGRRGTAMRRILVEFRQGNVTRSYHATKGWRVTRS